MIKDFVFGLFTIIFSSVVLVVAFGYPHESSYFPRAIAFFIGAMGVILFSRATLAMCSKEGGFFSFLEEKQKLYSLVASKDNFYFIFIFCSLVVYLVLLYTFNYLVATFVFLMATIHFLGFKKIIKNSIISLFALSLLYFIFFYLLSIASMDSLFFNF